MNPRVADTIGRVLVLAVIGLALTFLVAPLLVTTLMAFDARGYLGPMPPPDLSLRWFARLLSQDALRT